MNNLDISDSLSSPFPWLPYGASQFSEYQINGDMTNYLSQRSVMLEPIIEETSDDDDVSGGPNGHVWSHYDNQWSSESETGSVIRVELIQESDTISERDFACPAKRRKQDECNDEIVLRKTAALNDDYKYRIDLLDPPTAIESFGKRYCIDGNNYDRYSDPDSLSFNSLSRSSSLIQFESLERQMQNGDNQSFGGSSPSIHNQVIDANNKIDFSTGKSNESNETSSVRCYYDIEKIDFNSALFLNCQEQTSSSESSSSTDNSIYYSDNRESDADAKECIVSENEEILRPKRTSNPKLAFRCKNSVENLSEDSGYGEFPSLKSRSKSIPNLNQDQLIEEDEELDNHRSLNNISGHYNNNRNSSKRGDCDAAFVVHSTNIHSKGHQIAVCGSDESSKIDSTQPSLRSAGYTSAFGSSKNSTREHCWNGNSSVCVASTNANTSIGSGMNNSRKSSSSTSLQNTSSASLPDILVHFGVFGESATANGDDDDPIFYCDSINSSKKSKKKSVCGDLLLSETCSLFEKDSFIVSSVPSNLNIYSTKCTSDGDFGATDDRCEIDYWNSTTHGRDINNFWLQTSTTPSVASKNFDLARTFGKVDNYHHTTTSTAAAATTTPSSQQTFQQQKIINSSYSNLTILDYSGSTLSTRTAFSNQLRTMAEKQKRNSTTSIRSSGGSSEFSKCNFLLDEISAHFDRSLSILNDKSAIDDDSDPVKDQILETKEIVLKPPHPPPRKPHTIKKPDLDATCEALIDAQKLTQIPDHTEFIEPNERFTFDRDPTNLKTCYADSLERCNFDLIGTSSNSIDLTEKSKSHFNTNSFSPSKHSTPAKRELVVSTPNLYLHKNDATNDPLHTSSTHNSLNPLPQSEAVVGQMKGILSAGSRNSLGKGVSFYPYVSEISWLEQSSAEDTAEISDTESCDNKNFNDMSNSTSIELSTEIQQQNHQQSTLNNSTAGHTTTTHSTSTTTTNTNSNNADDGNNSYAIDSSDENLYYETQPRSLAALAERDRRREQIYLQQQAKQQQQMNVKSNIVNKNTTRSSNNIDSKDQQQKQRQQQAERCVDSGGTSIRTNAIDVSTAMIVNERVSNSNTSGADQQCDVVDFSLSGQRNVAKNNQNFNDNSVSNFSNNISGGDIKNDKKRKMEKSKSGTLSAINVPVAATPTPTKSDSLPLKQAFDKKTRPGFLSRFTNFRFSLRGNKKKLKSIENNSGPATTSANNIVLVSTKGATNSTASNANQVPLRSKNSNSSRAGIHQRNSMRSNEFEYIPLKDPIAADYEQMKSSDTNNIIASTNINNNVLSSPSAKNETTITEKKHVLTAKPPLPRQPPRVVGVCAKHPQSQNSTHPNNGKAATLAAGGRHAHQQQQRSTSAPREIQYTNADARQNFHLANASDYDDDDDVDFFYNQLRSGKRMNQTICGGDVGNLKSAVSSDGILMDSNPDESTYTEDSFCTADHYRDHGKIIGLIETNLDTDETIISGKTRSLMELGPQQLTNRSSASAAARRLGVGKHGAGGNGATSNIEPRRPHKSMEFLLDKENQRFVLPPENELQKSHDNNTNYSEHQLRVQASLQRLNIPEWFRQYSGAAGAKPGENSSGGYVPGSFTKKRNSDVQRWAGLNSKTTSLSSLGSHRSDRSPLLLSPSAQSHHGQTGFSRWSTSHLNSSQTSPSASTRGSFSRGGPNSSILSNQSYGSANQSIRSSFRQPYLGWRSQERLSQPRTPHERLASSMLTRQQAKQQQQQQQQQQSSTQSTITEKESLNIKTNTEQPAVTPEIQSSIKEVTSAIVHFVNDQNNRATSSNSRSRSTSPSSRNCWLESSFVGNKPMDSPQTPVIDTSFSPRDNSQAIGTSTAATSTRVNGVVTPIPILTIQTDRPSPSSATLEDVLASLLGLPTDSYRSSGDTAANINDTCWDSSSTHLTIDAHPLRRRSEGDAQKRNDSATPDNSSPSQRRVSLDSSESKSATGAISSNVSAVSGSGGVDVTKCRYPKCEASAVVSEARKHYKSCHNCSYMYCSRECRRAHWEKHRKACLHSRVSVLCRQVLSSCKDDADTLKHLSILARRGYITQGRGVVRILFRSPESAEMFVKQGFQRIGEASYVRWPELMPQEMGPELYSELLRLSTEYKPDSKMLIYVAICVVSEAPSSAATSVKWERQLVSRCAKLKLSKAIPNDLIGGGLNSSANTGQQQQQQASTTAASALVGTSSTAQAKVESDVLILTFNLTGNHQNTVRNRELILQNIQIMLKRRGVSLRKHYPEIFQRLSTFIEGSTDRFLPVTLHPRDANTGQSFICIIMPNIGDSDRVKMPESENGNIVQTIDCLDLNQISLTE